MSIHPIGNSDAAKAYSRVGDKRGDAKADGASKAKPDSVEISPEATLIAKAKNAESATRTERLASIKAEVDNGTYVTEEKLSEALDTAIDQTLTGL